MGERDVEGGGGERGEREREREGAEGKTQHVVPHFTTTEFISPSFPSSPPSSPHPFHWTFAHLPCCAHRREMQ